METIFDHNVTKEELKDILGFDSWTREELLSINCTQRDHYGVIYRLYRYRGDKEKAKEYADKIPDDDYKNYETCYHDH